MGTKDTIIFDLDGTLLNSLTDLMNSANYTMQQMGYPTRSKDEIRHFVGNGIAVLIQKCVPAGTSEEAIDRAIAIFKEHYGVHCNDYTATYEGIDELLAALSERNIKMAIVSNKADFAVKELADIYFKGIIPVAIGEMESEGVRKKPAPDTVYKALELLNSTVEHSFYVGDSEVDFKTAMNAGMDAVLCSWGFRDTQELQAMGAEVIIDRPMELLKLL